MSKEVLGIPTHLESAAKALLDSNCLMFGEFKLKSGLMSSYYVNTRRLKSHPAERRAVAMAVSRQIDRKVSNGFINPFASLSDTPTGITYFTGIVAHELELPMITPRTDKKEHGTGDSIEGDYDHGQVTLLLEDVATTGGSIITAADVLRNGQKNSDGTFSNLRVPEAYVLVNRLQGAEDLLTKNNMRLHSLFDVPNLVQFYWDAKLISEEHYRKTMDTYPQYKQAA